jgi:regulator of protease activity HflC (stomatin/prohibitin superfamily)
MTQTLVLVLILAAILLIVGVKAMRLRRVVVYEYQRGLKYRNGKFLETLGAGRYRIFSNTTIMPVDVRPMLVTIPSQEVISADGVTVKITVVAQYEVADPAIAINKNANYQQAFYLLMQMAVRQLISAEKVDSIIEQRASLSNRIVELTQEKIAALGLRLISAEVKDVMLPGELRRTFAQVVKAQKEGQAALERARGETAAMRSLANAAKMAEGNPNLLQLRALQLMSESSGNTIMLGVPSAITGSVSGNGKAQKDESGQRD